jgi:hypothetical protein
MADNYDGSNSPITVGWWSTEHVAGALVIGALLYLILVGRGFRGVSAGGVSVGIR